MRLSKHFLRAVQDEYMHVSPRPSRLLGIWVESKPFRDNDMQGEFNAVMATSDGPQVITLVLDGWACDLPLERDRTNLGIFQALHGWEKSQLKDKELRERAAAYTDGAPITYEMHQEICAEYAKACKEDSRISIMEIAVKVQDRYRKAKA